MPKPTQDIDIEIVEPEGGIDPNRLSLVLSMLISEKDVIEYIRRNNSSNRNPDHTPTDSKPTPAPPD